MLHGAILFEKVECLNLFFDEFGSLDTLSDLIFIPEMCLGYECLVQARAEIIVAQRVMFSHFQEL